jgi:hypothetical protein
MASTVLGNVDNIFVVEGTPKVVPVPDTAPTRGEDALQRFIDREIVTRLSKNVGWRQLELCFKWKRVSEYMTTKGICDDDMLVGSVRSLLQCNKLDAVEYDAHSHRIVKLGIPDIDARAIISPV